MPTQSGAMKAACSSHARWCDIHSDRPDPLASLLDRPNETLERWDQLSRGVLSWR